MDRAETMKQIKAMSQVKGVASNAEDVIIKSGANNGAYNDQNDPNGSKRGKIAEEYYEQIRNRNRKYEIKAVAKNSGFTEEIVSISLCKHL